MMVIKLIFQKQFEFSRDLAKLIEFAYSLGLTVSMGECWRPPEMAKIYARQGKGIVNSLHTERLAVDLNLFKDGQVLTSDQDYKVLGEYWESLPGFKHCWGGRFGDGDHFSIEHNGVK